jgi:hypothetical protein
MLPQTTKHHQVCASVPTCSMQRVRARSKTRASLPPPQRTARLELVAQLMHSPAPSSHGAVTAQINKLRAGASGPPPRSWTGPPPGYRHPSKRAGATTGAGVEFWAQPESSAVASRLLVSVHSQHILTYVCVSLRDGHHVRAERDAEFIFRSCKLAHSRRRRQPLL